MSTQKKKYTIMGCLPEQAKYVTLSRLRVDKLNGVRFKFGFGWTKFYGQNLPSISPSEVDIMAKVHGCEMDKDCFYVPVGTIFYVPKDGFRNGIYMRHYKVDNPTMGHFNVYIEPTNIIPMEFGEV